MNKREEWVRNNEFLYYMKKQSKLSMRNFIREFKQTIDETISAELHPKKEPDRILNSRMR